MLRVLAEKRARIRDGFGAENGTHNSGDLRVEVFDPRSVTLQGEGDEDLARFNMPLELGIAIARRYMRTTSGGK